MNTDIMTLVKDIQDRVREVAYMMWESAGRQHGMAMQYWLQAESEVLTTMQAATERMMPEPVRGEGDASAGAEEQPRLAAEAVPGTPPAASAKASADEPAAAPANRSPAKRAEAKKPAAAAKSDDEPAAKPAAKKTRTRARAKASP